MRKGVRTKNLRDVVDPPGKRAEIIRRTRRQRLLREQTLVYEPWPLMEVADQGVAR